MAEKNRNLKKERVGNNATPIINNTRNNNHINNKDNNNSSNSNNNQNHLIKEMLFRSKINAAGLSILCHTKLFPLKEQKKKSFRFHLIISFVSPIRESETQYLFSYYLSPRFLNNLVETMYISVSAARVSQQGNLKLRSYKLS